MTASAASFSQASAMLRTIARCAGDIVLARSTHCCARLAYSVADITATHKHCPGSIVLLWATCLSVGRPSPPLWQRSIFRRCQAVLSRWGLGGGLKGGRSAWRRFNSRWRPCVPCWANEKPGSHARAFLPKRLLRSTRVEGDLFAAAAASIGCGDHSFHVSVCHISVCALVLALLEMPCNFVDGRSGDANRFVQLFFADAESLAPIAHL